MKRIAMTALALSIAAAAGGAIAQDPNFRYDNVRADYARVVDVQRVGGRYSNRVTQECWNERSNRYESGYYRDNSGRLYRGEPDSDKAGAILGAIIGGALGNQVGKGDGRKAATVAGAVIGGAIGAKQGNNRDDYYDEYRDSSGVVRRCRTFTEPTGAYGRRGYVVTYDYAGQTYKTFTQVRPGRTIPVVVDVRPR